MNLKLRKVLAFFMTLVLLLGNVNMALAEETGDQAAPAETTAPQDAPESQTKEIVEGGFNSEFGTVYITGQKIWNDKGNETLRPESITVQLCAGGIVVATQEVKAPDWSWSFDISNGVPGTGANPVGVKFTVTEESVPHYNQTDAKDPSIQFNYPSTNEAWTTINPCSSLNISSKQDAKSIVIAKKGNSYVCWTVDALRSFEADLIVAAYAAATNSSTDISKYTFISGFNASGHGMTVTEDKVFFNKTSDWSWLSYGVYNRGSADSTASSITNTPEGTSVSGEKTWDDANNQDNKRPESITINLLADGIVQKSIEVTEADGWKWSFENLPKYENGVEIVYTITEDAVAEYESQVNGFNVINTHKIEKTSVKVEKIWVDNNDQDGIRPESITINLLADGEVKETVEVTAEMGWTYTFTNLPVYKEGEVGQEIVYTVSEEAVEGYEPTIDGLVVTNKHTPAVTSVSGSKTWVDNDDQDGVRPESITIRLLADGKEVASKDVTADDGWAWSFTDLPMYRDQGTAIIYTITEDAVDNYETEINGFNVTNTHTPEVIEIGGSKTWNDNDNQDGKRPTSITIRLLADGTEVASKTVTAAENWSWTFKDLPKFANGEEIEYTITEDTVAEYESKVNGFDVTNTHEIETISVSGTKTWNDADNQDGARPEEITIRLKANGTEVASKTVTAADNWSWTFADLDKYENGKEITYTISEDAVAEYNTTYDGYNVTNSYTPKQTSVTVTKAWDDANDQDGVRPNDITVKLLADGKDTNKILVLNEGNNWSDSFTKLDMFAAGEKIVYTVEEVSVDGYTTEIKGDQTEGYTITNTHLPEVIEISGSKTWDDNNNQDGARPESITINLLADGVIIDTVEVTEKYDWSWNFKDLPKYRNGGVEIVYTITENAVEDYSAKVEGYDVTNTHTPEQTSVTVTKSWQDNDDQDGIRPEEITVILLADGEATGEKLVLDAEGNWTGSFTELDVYAEGEKIVYTVEEIEIEGYKTVITGDQTTGFQITNSHTPETIEISGSKTWDDANDQDGARPESITVNLMANGKVVKTATVTEAEDWSYTFENLPKYENGGNEIIYAITEEAVEGYTTTYDGYNITNSYTPAEISLTVTKAWADSDDEDGLRPSKVTILLYANGEKVDEKLVLSADSNWSGSFVGLPKYANGVEIVYTIGEVNVEGYNTVIRGNMTSGFVVTNSHTVIPQTGDERTPILWMLMLLGSVAVVAYMGYDYKRRMVK